MNLAEVHDLLTYAASIDNRKFDDATVVAWQSILAAVDPADAMAAARDHFATVTDYLMPVHVRRGAARVADERRREAVRREADERRRESEAIRAQATTDRRAEIAAFIRSVNGPGDPDKLHGRKAFWRREQRIQRDATPNPHFTGFPQPEDAA